MKIDFSKFMDPNYVAPERKSFFPEIQEKMNLGLTDAGVAEKTRELNELFATPDYNLGDEIHSFLAVEPNRHTTDEYRTVLAAILMRCGNLGLDQIAVVDIHIGDMKFDREKFAHSDTYRSFTIHANVKAMRETYNPKYAKIATMLAWAIGLDTAR